MAIAPLAASENTAAAGQETFGHSAALGINYTGGNFKIFLSGRIAAELRGQYSDRILIGGARLYSYPSIPGFHNARLRPFLAVEGDCMSFRGQLSKGNGAAVGGIGGVEYFLYKRLSVQTDVGPYYMTLKDDKSSVEKSGLEFVINFGVNFYFK